MYISVLHIRLLYTAARSGATKLFLNSFVCVQEVLCYIEVGAHGCWPWASLLIQCAVLFKIIKSKHKYWHIL